MRSDPLSPFAVLRALELYGPQARPYNFDDCFDCWGLVRRVFDHLDGGEEVDGELAGEQGGPEEGNWAAFATPDELAPGDLLVTHPHASTEFHTVFYCGRVAGQDLVYDASPRPLVPRFVRGAASAHGSPGEGWELVEARAIHTRYARATETTDRLRNDGGAYLRLWDDRERYYHRGLRARLEAGVAADPRAAGRDLVALRRAAGLSDLPFYCRSRLPTDAAGRELYDNVATRRLDYYVPDGAPTPDDEYGDPGRGVAASGRGARPSGAARRARPPAPRVTKAPLWVVRETPVTVEWEYRPAPPGEDVAAVEGCRVEVWEETADLWKHRLLRQDFAEPLTSFTVPDGLLRDDARYAVVVWARGPGGYSGTALAPFLLRPGRDNPLLRYDPVRPEDLAPDGGEEVPAGTPVELTWRIRRPLVSQAGFRLEVLEDAVLGDDVVPAYDVEASGPQAGACRAVVPGEVVRAGHTYSWYVTVRTTDGRTAFAPSEGVFRSGAGAGVPEGARPCPVSEEG
jgi:hypothetical protein